MFVTSSPEEGKHHLRLSESAFLCMESDRQTFSCTEKPISRDGFINRVFTEYRSYAKASFALQLQGQLQQRRDLRRRLCSDSEFSQSAQILERYDEACVKEELQAQAQQLMHRFSKSGGRSMKVRLNKENMNYLYGPNSLCDEQDYYKGSAGWYLRAVLEEYCRLDYAQRERIYFPVPLNDLLELEIAYSGTYRFYPIDILSQGLSPYNYLLGVSLDSQNGSGAYEWKPYSVRLTRILQYRKIPMPRGVTPPSETIRRLCYDTARQNGLSYVAGACDTIRVRLKKPEGLNLYRQILWYRPAVQEVEEETDSYIVYRFLCTPMQARIYFLRFGESAHILSPEPLRDEVGAFYEQAASLYRQDVSQL